jgi:4-hydroxybenzoate polyprenyltransferase
MSSVTDWLTQHYVVTYLIIYIFITYVYNKVFKVRKLPILKELIIYLLLGVGALILLFFQHDLQLPIVYSLTVAIILMFLVRIRYFIESRSQKRKP